MGTRSQLDYSRCFEKNSTAPPLTLKHKKLHGPALDTLSASPTGNAYRMLRRPATLRQALRRLRRHRRLRIRLARAFAVTLSLAIATVQPAASNAAGNWVWPVEPPYRILRPFIAPATQYSAGHRGIDIAASSARVLAPSAGVVHFAGVVVDRPVLSIRHPGGLISSYEPVIALVAEGQSVARGDLIGEVLPGHCSVPCIHFGVRRDGEYVSPLNYLGGIPRSILLPTR